MHVFIIIKHIAKEISTNESPKVYSIYFQRKYLISDRLLLGKINISSQNRFKLIRGPAIY